MGVYCSFGGTLSKTARAGVLQGGGQWPVQARRDHLTIGSGLLVKAARLIPNEQ